MKFTNLMICFSFAFLFMLSSCASKPVMVDAQDNTVFDYNLSQVKEAAKNALIENGFEITKEESAYLEGYRPHKIGLFVGSGGETVGVWLKKLGPNKTEVKIDTAKSFLGLAGQKDWSIDILYFMTKSLKSTS